MLWSMIVGDLGGAPLGVVAVPSISLGFRSYCFNGELIDIPFLV